MQPLEQSYNREEKALHGNNLQREHDTGGTPAPGLCKIFLGVFVGAGFGNFLFPLSNQV